MELKDWILLIVPILCNGIIIFILQKVFEKKQRKFAIKYEYFANIRNRIDISLELHAKLTRRANENHPINDEEINSIIGDFFNSCLDIYYYYVQNQTIFTCIKQHNEKLAVLIMEAIECSHDKRAYSTSISQKVNEIRDVLQKMKERSIR